MANYANYLLGMKSEEGELASLAEFKLQKTPAKTARYYLLPPCEYHVQWKVSLDGHGIVLL